MKIEVADDFINAPKGGSAEKKPTLPPTSLQFVKKVAVKNPARVCHCQGFTYVGKRNNEVDRIDQHGNVTAAYIKPPGFPECVTAHEARLYILVMGKSYSVHVYGLNGTQLLTWKHGDRDSSVSLGLALTIANNQLVIADRTWRSFLVYSLTGALMRSVTCDLIGETKVSMCSAEGNSILVTNNSTKPHLYKFNLTSGAVEWRSNETAEPSTITRLKGESALVCEITHRNQTKLFVMDTTAGELRF